MEMFFSSLIAIVSSPSTLLSVVLGSILGIAVGALPGLTAAMSIALLTGLTYGVPFDQALGLLMGVYVGAIYGGSQAAILVNVPGTPSAAATALEGHVLALKGEAGPAIGSATVASVVGTLLGTLVLLTLAPVIAQLAREFGSWEFALLAIFGIVISGSMTSRSDPLKGWIAGFAGLLLSTVGVEPIYSYARYAYGSIYLASGFAFVAAMIGLFGMSEVLTVIQPTRYSTKAAGQATRVRPPFKLLWRLLPVKLRSALIGVFIGVIPGAGEDIAAWISYDTAKRLSSRKDEFGQGSYEGMVAAETANNACIGGALIPTLTLAVPGSAVTAVALGAFYLHGLRPGPLLLVEAPDFIARLSAILVIASISILVFGLLLAKVLVRMLQIPRERLLPIIVVLAAVGAYAVNARIDDLLTLYLFGLLGFALRFLGFPVAPMVLGLILGPMADQNLRRSLMLTDGSLLPFVSRPISLLLLITTVLFLLADTGVLQRIGARLKLTAARLRH